MSATAHTPFCASYEHLYVMGASDSDPPALLINSDAEAMALAGAARARSDRLEQALELWERFECGDVTGPELARTLGPVAREIGLLLDALIRKLK